MKPSYHYYEAHITVEPVFDERLKEFTETCKGSEFHVAKLLMEKGEPSRKDAFCTGRDKDYEALHHRMFSLLGKLRKAKFKIWRFKIESIMLDSRYDPTFQILLDPEAS